MVGAGHEPVLRAARLSEVIRPHTDTTVAGLIAAYRKCTHLGCSVPWNAAEDQFHCPCHGSLYDKHTAVVKGGPAPKPLQLFHIITDASGTLIVDTNPLNVIDRQANVWDPKVLEITE